MPLSATSPLSRSSLFRFRTQACASSSKSPLCCDDHPTASARQVEVAAKQVVDDATRVLVAKQVAADAIRHPGLAAIRAIAAADAIGHPGLAAIPVFAAIQAAAKVLAAAHVLAAAQVLAADQLAAAQVLAAVGVLAADISVQLLSIPERIRPWLG